MSGATLPSGCHPYLPLGENDGPVPALPPRSSQSASELSSDVPALPPSRKNQERGRVSSTRPVGSLPANLRRTPSSSADAALPPNWINYFSQKRGHKYYHNSMTGETVWSKPTAAPAPQKVAPCVPSRGDDAHASPPPVSRRRDRSSRQSFTSIPNASVEFNQNDLPLVPSRSRSVRGRNDPPLPIPGGLPQRQTSDDLPSPVRQVLKQMVEKCFTEAYHSAMPTAGVPWTDDGRRLCVIIPGSQVQLKVYRGDVTKEPTEAIVISAAKSLEMSEVRMAKALLGVAGQSVQNECDQLKASKSFNYCDAFTTRAGNMPKCQKIVHAICPRYDSSNGKTNLEKLVMNCLEEVKRNGLKSVALPALGTGGFNYPPIECAQATLSAISNFAANPGSVTKINIIIYNARAHLSTFQSEFKQHFLSGKSASSSGRIAQIKGFYSSSRSQPPSAPTDTVPHGRRHAKTRSADMVDFKPRHTDESRMKAKQQTKKISRKRRRFPVDLARMQEFDSGTSLSGSSLTAGVQRINLLAPKVDWLPSGWDQMSKHDTLRLVNLPPSSAEYQTVLKKFSATCHQTVTQIHRIQNPQLYLCYQAYVDALDHDQQCTKKANEMELWHGADVDTIKKIYSNGFNRNFAGVNGTTYGHGDYFARDAKYSERYSRARQSQPPFKMLLVKVAVGDYCVGNRSMKQPPSRDGSSGTTNLYCTTVDDVSNPRIFVTYRDSQKYPAYIITFA